MFLYCVAMKKLLSSLSAVWLMVCLSAPGLSWADMPAKAAACAGCHGVNGNASMPGVPSLAAQNARYTYLQLRDFQEGRRHNDLMTPMTAGLTKDDMREIADYFSKQKLTSKGFKADPDKAKLGKAKADETLCAMCHLGEFVGQNEIPKVAGQNYDYVIKTMKDFKAKTRTNDAGNMTSVASTLSEADIENLAHYISGLN
jgi:cytochrome c553